MLSIFNHVRLFMTPQMLASQVLLSMGFSRLPFPPPEDLPDPGTEPTSPALKADSLFTEPPGASAIGLKNI